MLSYSLLNNHAGLTLCGNTTSLLELNSTVRAVNDESPIIKNKDGVLLALAGDAETATEGQRRIIKSRELFIDSASLLGFDANWPTILVQCRMLRASLDLFSSTKRQQAMTYWLEAVIEEALHEDFKERAALIIKHWQAIDPIISWAEEKLPSRTKQYKQWSGRERKQKIIGLLASLDATYPAQYRQWVAQDNIVINLEERHYHRTNLVSPTELDAFCDKECLDARH